MLDHAVTVTNETTSKSNMRISKEINNRKGLPKKNFVCGIMIIVYIFKIVHSYLYCSFNEKQELRLHGSKTSRPLGYYDRPIDKPTGQPTDDRPGRVITFRVSQIRGTSKNIINKYSLAQDRDERLLESNAFD